LYSPLFFIFSFYAILGQPPTPGGYVTEEGIIKYDPSRFTYIPFLPRHEYERVEKYRKILNQMNLIGAYDNGVGFGNISQRKNYSHILRTQNPQFIISGSQTGHLKDLSGEHYTRVIDVDIDAFAVTAQGAVKASSETVTHASIYQRNPYIQAVVHFHHKKVWDNMIKGDYEFTGKWILYGTYEMAIAVRDCIGDKTQGIFVMKGHEEGAIAYGPNLSTVMHIINRIYKKYIK
jgi:ribulose-5-phosphate 4-epimerase/fuculose-1-phosphate aldolase